MPTIAWMAAVPAVLAAAGPGASGLAESGMIDPLLERPVPAFTQAEALWLIGEMGGQAGEVRRTAEGFEVDGSAYGLNFWLTGYDCVPAGDDLGCAGMDINAEFEAKSAEQAAHWARSLSFAFVADSARGASYTLTRSEFIDPPMSRARLRQTLSVFIGVALNAWDRMAPLAAAVPPDANAKPDATSDSPPAAI